MRIFLLSLFLLTSITAFTQDSTSCVVYHYFDATDTSQKELDRKITYDSRGRIICSVSFASVTEMDEAFYQTGNVRRYVYKDSVLIEKVETRYQENPLKTVYTYNEQGKCINESIFSWEANHTAAPVKPGMPQGVATVSGKWNQVSYATITYDDKGRKVMWDASRLHNHAKSLFKWTYDDKGNVTSFETYFRGGRLVEKTDYQYFDWGYRYWTILYADDGTPRHELEKGQGYQSMLVHAVTLDKAGKVIADKITDESGKERYTTKTFYDKKGRVEKEVRYGADGKEDDMWVYKYSN